MSSTAELQLAYKEACFHGSKNNYRIHLAVMGHSEAGKTSFIDRLLGKEFQPQRESTEGIQTHFVESFFSKKDVVSNMWTETIFEAGKLEKDFHESLLANIKSKELESLNSESPHQKVVRWLQNTTPNGLASSANDAPNLDMASLESSKPTYPVVAYPKKKEFYQEPYTEVELTMDNKGARRQEEVFYDDEDITKPNIAKMGFEEYSQPLQSKINTGLPYDKIIKDKSGTNQLISSEAFPSTKNYQAHLTFETTDSNNNDNESEEPLYLNQEITSKMSYATLNRLKHRKETYATSSDERIPYSLNIWDHGGQNEFIITNQLFLNVEAFILMVMDIS